MMTWIKKSEDGEIPEARGKDIIVYQRARRHQYNAPGEDLRGAFTRYVISINSQGEPTCRMFEDMWQALRVALTYELRRCSLWTSPPSYLGVYGWRSWREREPGPGRTESALDELMVDCYSEIFLKRLPRLLDQLKVKTDIDGLVFIYLRNFVHDRRKAHDPLGFRVFETLRKAVRQAVENGEIFVVGGDPKILNSTVLAFDPEADSGEAAETPDLESIVEHWNDDLVPGIMTASGTERQALIVRLRDHLLGLRAHGLRVFCIRDVVHPLKKDIRARWAVLFERDRGDAVLEECEGGPASVVRLIHPDSRPEEQDSFRELVRRVAMGLERLDFSARTRLYLRKLWRFLAAFASHQGLDSLPSNRKLAELLGIPRDRLPGLYEDLRDVIRQYRATVALPLHVVNEMGYSTTNVPQPPQGAI